MLVEVGDDELVRQNFVACLIAYCILHQTTPESAVILVSEYVTDDTWEEILEAIASLEAPEQSE